MEGEGRRRRYSPEEWEGRWAIVVDGEVRPGPWTIEGWAHEREKRRETRRLGSERGEE